MAEPVSLSPNVQALIDEIKAAQALTPASARDLLARSAITPADLEPWADFDHPSADSYGRNLVYDGGCFELMVMSWVDGDMAAIHDHGHTQWGAVKLFGPAEHAVFKVEDGVLRTTDRRVFEPGSVLGVSHEMIHQMGNMGQEPYLTLHLYGCYEREGDVTGDARLYELEEGRIQRTSGGVFFNLPEEQVNRRQDCPQADFPTRIRHRVELLKRLMTTNGSWTEGFQSTREKELAASLFAASTWNQLAEEWQQAMAWSTSRVDRWLGILHQELHATAALQQQLLDAEMIDAPIAKTIDRARLAELLAFNDLEAFADGYLELIESAHGVTLPGLVAA